MDQILTFDKQIDLTRLRDEISSHPVRPNKVIIMAGGLGERLGELTRHVPKPMLPLGDKPVLERIIQSFIDYGMRDISISVNYKRECIREYFGDGSEFGAEISYVEENKRMGTAGALSLIDEVPEHPVIIMNGDLLTSLNFDSLMQFHSERDALATLCVKECTYQIPFGTVNTFDSQVVSLQEKPPHSFFINAGIYVLAPELLKRVPLDTYYDITTLFGELIEQNEPINSYVVNEFWMDIGHNQDYQKAQELFRQNRER